MSNADVLWIIAAMSAKKVIKYLKRSLVLHTINVSLDLSSKYKLLTYLWFRGKHCQTFRHNSRIFCIQFSRSQEKKFFSVGFKAISLATIRVLSSGTVFDTRYGIPHSIVIIEQIKHKLWFESKRKWVLWVETCSSVWEKNALKIELIVWIDVWKEWIVVEDHQIEWLSDRRINWHQNEWTRRLVSFEFLVFRSLRYHRNRFAGVLGFNDNYNESINLPKTHQNFCEENFFQQIICCKCFQQIVSYFVGWPHFSGPKKTY